MCFPQVSLIHYSSFRAISPNIFINNTASIPLPRSESQATALFFCPPPLNSPFVQPDGAVLITSDLTVIGPAQLHQGDPSAVGEGPASVN